MITRPIHDPASRLSGSLALSIAYGIQADTPDNEFFRMYKDMLDELTEALVPGTFFVDILPPRGSNDPLSMRRALIDDDQPQSGICLPGSQVHDSTRVQKKLSGTCTRLKPAR